MEKKIISAIILNVLIICTLAQNHKFEWTRSTIGDKQERAKYTIYDKSGNLFVVGNYEGAIEFTDQTSEFEISSDGGFDVFIVKFDSNGNIIWVRTFGGVLDVFVECISSDSNGAIYLTGSFIGTVDFDPSKESDYKITNDLSRNIFLLKLDSSGNFNWVNTFGNTNDCSGYSTCIDDKNNIILTGYFSGTVDFDPSLEENNLVSEKLFTSNIFVCKYNSNQSLLWAKSMNGLENSIGQSVTCDSVGDIYITGDFKGKVDFDPSEAILEKVSKGANDIFILKLDSHGNYKWVKTMGSKEHDIGYSITTDYLGNVLLVGSYSGTISFESEDEIIDHNNEGIVDIVIAKLDSIGNYIWVQTIGGQSIDYSHFIRTDSEGNIYLTGHFRDIIDFDSGESSFQVKAVGSDFFILKMNVLGEFVWVRTIANLSSAWGFPFTINESDEIYISGTFGKSIEFDQENMHLNLTLSGALDAFFMKMSKSSSLIINRKLKHTVIAYPNPVTQDINIDLGNHYKEIIINTKDLTGRLLSTSSYDYAQNIKLALPNQSAIYLIEVFSDKELLTIIRVIKN